MKITRRSVPVKAAINKLPAGIKPADTPIANNNLLLLNGLELNIDLF